MKKIKKLTALLLAVMTVVSVFSLNVFANENIFLQYESGADSVSDREIRTGVLPNGLEYKIVPMTADEINALNSGISTHSYSWTGNVSVPIANSTGTNGAQLGYDFIIAPDSVAVISVGSLPTTTMPTINVGAAATNGMWTDWIPNVKGNSKVYLTPGSGYTGYSYRVKVSTSESYSRSARFSITTE